MNNQQHLTQDKERKEIPKCLSHLKVDERGYPIPFFVPMVEGKPQFLYMDKQKLDKAIDENLCHICGKKLHKDYHYFVSGPMGLQNKVSSDAAMHRDCAEFALAVCPHMLYKKSERKAVNPNYSFNETPIMNEKPDFLYLIKSSKYKAKFYPEFGYRLIHYNSVSAEKYIYVNNKLQKA